jgi:hypothetical protein
MLMAPGTQGPRRIRRLVLQAMTVGRGGGSARRRPANPRGTRWRRCRRENARGYGHNDFKISRARRTLRANSGSKDNAERRPLLASRPGCTRDARAVFA